MLEYRGSVFAWNAVNVLVDGLLQHGKIVNLAEGGLIIDFECQTQRSQFVAYGPVFRCDVPPCHWPPHENVQVLLRQHPDAPWIWYPGKSFPLDNYYFVEAAFVQVQLPHGTVEEMVGWDQVRSALRYRSSEDLRRVEPNDFVIRACPLPVTYWSDANPQLEEILKSAVNRRYRVLCTAVLSQTLLYLQGQYGTALTSEQLQGEYDLAKQEQATGGSLPAHPLTDCELDTASKKREVAEELRCLPLPTELLLEVFQALDSIGRIRCRRVCHVWNSILINAAFFPDVRVSGQAGYYEKDGSRSGAYWMLACLLKCLTSAIKMALISSLYRKGFALLAAPFRRVFNESRQIPVVVWHKCELDKAYEGVTDLIGRLADRMWKCSCARMMWSNCCIDYDGRVVTVAHHTFTIGSRADANVQMWNLFEYLQAAKKPFDVQALSGWVADCLAHQRRDEIDKVVWHMNEYQSPDPRPTTQYRGVKWTVANISDLDVSKLSRLTTAFLSEFIKPDREQV
ncbi:uncharacterized protein LOC129600254 [Paramacrobiotus metropolitanus]|uniref:uncharacterized protein LOC129600254 n=1 Tax=Paramacrobiotus metropolitanus TaxID=2943436 RepID=UPI002445FFC6|nr:uncharacterized protein LOC129600254 [Paramacrobiotus metropolitanus]